MSGFAERDSAHTESLDTHLSTVAHKKDLNVHNTGHVTLLTGHVTGHHWHHCALAPICTALDLRANLRTGTTQARTQNT